MKQLPVGVVFISAMLLQSCSWVVITESVKGRAFVVKDAAFSSTYWNCDATKGEPTCFEVVKLGPDARLPAQASAAPAAAEPAAIPEETVQPAAEEKPAKTPPSKKKGKK